MEKEDRLFQQWVVQLPYMDKSTFISFENYKAAQTGANIDRRSVSEIEADVDAAERELMEVTHGS